jgi:hypothetical protein
MRSILSAQADQGKGSGETGRFPQRLETCLLEQDLQRQISGATPLDETNGDVEIHVLPQRELGRRLRGIARHLELLGPPGLDQLGGLVPDLHLCRSVHAHLFGQNGRPVVPLPGDISRQIEHLLPAEVALEPVRAVSD